jgi:DNA repair protein RadC/GGDEF domain-containing protein
VRTEAARRKPDADVPIRELLKNKYGKGPTWANFLVPGEGASKEGFEIAKDILSKNPGLKAFRVMIDIKNLKKINDLSGSEENTNTNFLSSFAQSFKEAIDAISNNSLMVKFGGDEWDSVIISGSKTDEDEIRQYLQIAHEKAIKHAAAMGIPSTVENARAQQPKLEGKALRIAYAADPNNPELEELISEYSNRLWNYLTGRGMGFRIGVSEITADKSFVKSADEISAQHHAEKEGLTLDAEATRELEEILAGNVSRIRDGLPPISFSRKRGMAENDTKGTGRLQKDPGERTGNFDSENQVSDDEKVLPSRLDTLLDQFGDEPQAKPENNKLLDALDSIAPTAPSGAIPSFFDFILKEKKVSPKDVAKDRDLIREYRAEYRQKYGEAIDNPPATLLHKLSGKQIPNIPAYPLHPWEDVEGKFESEDHQMSSMDNYLKKDLPRFKSALERFAAETPDVLPFATRNNELYHVVTKNLSAKNPWRTTTFYNDPNRGIIPSGHGEHRTKVEAIEDAYAHGHNQFRPDISFSRKQLQAAEGSEDNKLLSALDSLPDPELIETLEKNGVSYKIERDLSEDPRFSKKSPHSVSDRAAPGEQLTIDFLGDVPWNTEIPAPLAEKFYQTTKHIRVGSFEHNMEHVTNEREASNVFAPMARGAREQVAMLILDDKDKPLAIFRVSMGTKDSSSAYPDEMMAGVLRTPGAAKFYIGHNHPSGSVKFSDADMLLANALRKNAAGMGVEFMGSVVVGDDTARFDNGSPGQEFHIPSGGKKTSTDVLMSEFESRSKSAVVTNAEAVADYLNSEESFLDKQSGILLLDHQLRVVGEIAMDHSEMLKLRANNKSTAGSRLLQVMDKANANAMIATSMVKSSKEHAAISNNLTEFGNAFNIRVLDVINLSGTGKVNITSQNSARDLGYLRSSGTLFFSKKKGEPGLKYSYAGVIGKNPKNFSEVERRLNAGEDPETVRKETGWFKNPYDKHYRFELDDSKMKFDYDKLADEEFSQANLKTKLSDILDHPELFEAYPELRNLSVMNADIGKSNGQYAPGKNGDLGWLAINKKNLTPEEAKDTLVHEIQHVIQEIEGFAKGGSPGEFIAKRKKQIDDLFEEVRYLNREMSQAVGTPAYRELIDRRSEITAKIRALEGNSELGAIEEGFNDYKRTAGEIEARDVTERRNLPPAARKRFKPLTDRLTHSELKYQPDEALIRYSYAGKAAIRPEKAATWKNARTMLDAGEDPETVRKETGWFVSPYDSQPRFELDDSKARWNERSLNKFLAKNPNTGAQIGLLTMSDALDHKDLFRAYPQLKDMRLRIAISPKEGTDGYFRSGGGKDPEIFVQAPDFETLKEVALHEIQHAIQNIEGFARGGSPLDFEPDSGDDARRKAAESWSVKAREVFANASPEFQSAARAMNREFDLDKVGTGEDQSAGYEAARRKLYEISEDEAWDYLTYSDSADRVWHGQFDRDANGDLVRPASSADKYRRLAGEIEARDTAERTELTREEREEFPPFSTAGYDPKDAIVQFSKKLKEDQKKNLYVAHNLSAGNLLHAEEIGGLAMPSVAVASVDAGPFSGFGDITLLAKPDLLESPKAKTFDADIYSPRHPASKADINDKKYSAFIDSLGDPQGLNSLYRHEPPQDPQVLFHNSAVRLAWLRSKGLAPEAKKKAHSEIFEKLSKFKGHRFDLRENPEVKKLVAEHYRQILESFPEEDREYFSSRYFQENGEVKENLVGHVLTDAEYWAKDGGIDTAQLREDIDKIIKDPENRKEFEAWTEEKFNSMTDGRKLFAGFNSKGQKKYKPYTMENIVKEMGKSLKGGEAFSYSGAAPIRAAHAKQYKSIEAIQADRNRIVSDADFEAIKEESNKKLSDLLEEIRPFYKFSAQGLDYSLDAGKAIAEGPKGLREAFDLDEDANKKVQEFVSYLKKLPTEYFEAKIQRAVSLSEFETAIVPEGTQAKIIDALENKGVRVATYKAGDHEDRLRAIRENATLFSKKSSADPLDPDPEPMPTLTEVSKSQANLLTDSLKKIAGGLLGDTKSQADRKRPDFQRAAALNPEADTDWEMDRDNKNKASVESRKFEDQLILKHLDADKNLIISTIKKLPDGDLRDWALKKAARVLAPYQAAKPIERLLFTVAEGITWDGSKIVASPGVRQFNKESGEYYYEKDQERARAAMHFFNSLSPEWREIMTERAKNNEEYRQEFTGKVIPYRKAQVAIALLARAKQMNASRSEQEGAEAEARSSIDAIKGKIDTKDLTKLRSLLDQLSNVTPENMPRQILSLEHIIRDSVGELRSPASLRAELKKLNTNKGHYGYVHHHFTGEKTPSQGKAFDALGKIPHSWLEETPGSDKLRVNAEGYEKNLLRADIARSSKELRAEAANNWMSQVEDQRGLPTEEFADHEEMPDGYAEKKKVIANFGKYRGQEIYLPDGLYEHYKLVKEKGLEDPGMKDFGEVVQLVDSVTNRMNEAMLYHTGKFARDMFAMPLHLMEFMRDYSIKNPREIFFTMKALTKALGQAATPKAWQKDTPESFGEYSESLAYQNKGDETSFFTKAGDSIGSWLTKTVPVGSTAAALLREINLSGAGDLPIKRVLQSVGEQIADKRGLSGKERSRFIFDLVNEYGFYTQDLPTILSYMRGQRPTQGSRAWGAIMRTTLPFLGYSSRLVKQMIADPVTKGMAPLAKRAVGMADQNSNLLAEISEASRPFAWLFLKSLVTAGLGGLIPPEEEGLATGVQDAKNLDPLARTTGRVLWSRDKNPDGGENWLSTKGLGQFQVADSIDAAIRGKSSIQDFSAEFLTLHPSMQLFLSTLGVSDPYSAKVPMTAKLGRSMAQAMVPQFTRVGPELAKFFRAVSGANTIPDAKKQTFFTAFFEQLGIPAGEVKVDSKGKIRTTENGLELLKLAGINIRHIPYDMISAAAEDEVKGLDYLEKRLDKIQEYRDGDRNPGMPEREFIAQELKSNRWLTIDEAEKETTDELKKRGQGILATVAKLREKGRPIAAPEPPKKAARGGFADPFKSKMFRDPFEEKKEKKEKRKTIEDIIRDIGNDTTVPKGGIDDILNRL